MFSQQGGQAKAPGAQPRQDMEPPWPARNHPGDGKPIWGHGAHRCAPRQGCKADALGQIRQGLGQGREISLVICQPDLGSRLVPVMGGAKDEPLWRWSDVAAPCDRAGLQARCDGDLTSHRLQLNLRDQARHIASGAKNHGLSTPHFPALWVEERPAPGVMEQV